MPKKLNDYIFNGSFLWKDLKTDTSYDFSPKKVYMVEDINDMARTFVMEFVDESGINEFVGLWRKKEKQVLLYGNYLSEENALNVSLVRIQDVKVENINTSDQKYKRIRVVCTEVIDNFLSQGFVEKKGYKNKTAQEIFKDVFSAHTGIGIEIEAYSQGKDINIPLLLNPYWTKRKFLKYVMNNYVANGPGKLITRYSQSDGKIDGVKIAMYPLQYLMEGKLKVGPELKVEPDNTNTNGIHTDYFIHGPSRMDRVYKDYKDQALYVFNEQKGIEPSELTIDDFNSDNTIGPAFEDNDDRGYVTPYFTNTSKNFEVCVKTGSILSELDTEKGISSTNMKIDCEPKPIVQHKELNSFYQYQSQNFVLECVVAPSNQIQIGHVYNIKLPSRNQQNNFGLEDKTLSGKWLLSRVEHTMYQKGERYEYKPKCYFIRTGLENAPTTDKTAVKVEDKSLQEKKPKANKTNKDKFGSMKNIAKSKISEAKKKTGKIASNASSLKDKASGALDSAKSGIASGVSGIAGGLASAKSGLVKIGSAIKGKFGQGNGTATNVNNGIKSKVSTISTTLTSGKASLAGVSTVSNVVTKAKNFNASEISNPDGKIKVIEGDMEVDGVKGKVNGIVKGDISNNTVKGDMLANFDSGSGNQVVSGNIGATYDSSTTATTGDFDGNEVDDYSDEEIQEGLQNNDPIIGNWFKK